MMGRFSKRRSTFIYVVQIDGRPVVAFRAVSQAEARELIKEHWFRSELGGLMSDGIPLWNYQAKVGVRAATFSEVEAAAPILAAANSSEGLALAYLVDLDRTPDGEGLSR
jgi:hypothetical protein